MRRIHSWSPAEKGMLVAVTLAALALAIAPNWSRIYPTVTGMPRTIVPPATVSCRAIAWSPDGKYVASLLSESRQKRSPYEGTVSVWDTDSLNLVRTVPLPRHTYHLGGTKTLRSMLFLGNGLTWWHDGSLVASGYDGPPWLIPPGATKSQPLVRPWPTTHSQPMNYFSRDERSGISVGNRLYWLQRSKSGWTATDVKVKPRTHDLAAILPSGDRCVIVVPQPLANPKVIYPPCLLELVDLKTAKVLWSKAEGEVRSLEISPSGDAVYVTYGEVKREGVMERTLSSCLVALRVRDGKELWRTPREKNRALDSLAVSPDGHFIAGRQFNRRGEPEVRILNTEAGSEVTTLKTRGSIPALGAARSYGYSLGRQMVFSPNGDRLALADVYAIIIWNSRNWGFDADTVKPASP